MMMGMGEASRPARAALGNRESCVVEQPESPSPLSVGIEWASRITTIGLEFVLPMVLGYGMDSWLRTSPFGTLAGAVLGFALGMWQTIRMGRRLPGALRRPVKGYRDPGDRHGRSGDAGPP
jgi:hypothetical protein